MSTLVRLADFCLKITLYLYSIIDYVSYVYKQLVNTLSSFRCKATTIPVC